jgi:urease accessory protein
MGTSTATRMSTFTDTRMVASSQGASDRLSFLRLLQLASPALPIGAFAYSQGLEAAVAAALVSDERSASAWILGLLAGPLGCLDLPVFVRIERAFSAGAADEAWRWNAVLLASRATAELQAEDVHLGAALARVLATLEISEATASPSASSSSSSVGPPRRAAYATMFALATARFQIDPRAALEAFAFTWAEAQTSAAVRLVPLGQSAGVRILADAARAIPAVVDRARAVSDDDIGAAAPLLALLSTAHETQYSRLFRS